MSIRWLLPSALRRKRSKPCGCEYPNGWHSAGVPQAECINDSAREETRETEAAIITEWILVREFRCYECGDTFERETGMVVERDIKWKDEEKPTRERKND